MPGVRALGVAVGRSQVTPAQEPLALAFPATCGQAQWASVLGAALRSNTQLWPLEFGRVTPKPSGIGDADREGHWL